MMTTLVYIIAYLGLAFFLIAVVARFMMWSKMPMHLRWELYPVAHEGADVPPMAVPTSKRATGGRRNAKCRCSGNSR